MTEDGPYLRALAQLEGHAVGGDGDAYVITDAESVRCMELIDLVDNLVLALQVNRAAHQDEGRVQSIFIAAVL